MIRESPFSDKSSNVSKGLSRLGVVRLEIRALLYAGKFSLQFGLIIQKSYYS